MDPTLRKKKLCLSFTAQRQFHQKAKEVEVQSFWIITQNRIYFTTAVEPSKINKTKMVEVCHQKMVTNGTKLEGTKRHTFMRFSNAIVKPEFLQSVMKNQINFCRTLCNSIQEYSEMRNLKTGEQAKIKRRICVIGLGYIGLPTTFINTNGA